MSEPVSSIKARRRAILERLRDWAEECLDNNIYTGYTVSLNKNIDIVSVKKMPLISIALGDADYNIEVYGRMYANASEQKSGITVYYPFTMFIYHWRNEETGFTHNYDVHILTDLIVEYLRTKHTNSTEMGTHGILGIEDISTRESDPMGYFKLTRMILSGRIKAIREDEP